MPDYQYQPQPPALEGKLTGQGTHLAGMRSSWSSGGTTAVQPADSQSQYYQQQQPQQHQQHQQQYGQKSNLVDQGAQLQQPQRTSMEKPGKVVIVDPMIPGPLRHHARVDSGVSMPAEPNEIIQGHVVNEPSGTAQRKVPITSGDQGSQRSPQFESMS